MSPTSRTPRGDSPALLTGASDPVAAFWDAHRRGRSIAVRTSGTTSAAARTIVRTTASWVDSFDAVAARLGLTASDRVWIPGEMDSTMNLFAACLAGHVGAGWSVDAAGATVARDAVLLTVKAHQVRDILPGLRGMFGPETSVVTMINGLPWWYFHRLDA